MKTIFKILCFLFFFAPSFCYGQMEEYNYKRELKGNPLQWHKIILPDEIFGKVSQDLTDIRIFGLTENNEIVETPYLLHLTTEKISNKYVAFKTLNISHNDKGYYLTFEVTNNETINEIETEFEQQNFDWRVTLEGSHNQKEWFTLIENYRILSIKNGLTDFQFSKIVFPDSKYQYYRLLINSKEKPKLHVAKISHHEIEEGTLKSFSIKKIEVKENKEDKQTEIDIELKLPVPVSHIKIGISDTFDYYRPVSIQYLTDSFKTEQGWKYNYSTLTSGNLNSIEKNELNFNSTTVQKLKILIDNQNNEPLSVDTISVKGYVHELVGRFTKKGTYFLVYGNKKASKPEYDITRFTNNIPETITNLELGKEQSITKEKAPMTEPLFKNKIWLWGIMTLIILLLGWFSIKMMKK